MNSLIPRKLLIIDDSVDNQLLFKTYFEDQGMVTYTASNGREALALLYGRSSLPDIILLDVQMPVMNGYEFRAEQQKCPRLSHIPVIVISAETERGLQDRMLNPFGVFSKPLRIDKLAECVASVS